MKSHAQTKKWRQIADLVERWNDKQEEPTSTL